ncbi:hypothetical protein ACLB2K_000699 [Fragaria x ananassa]
MCSMSKKEEEEVVFDLPEDVVVKILCRLPVKSLLRFTCVSKRWHSIISDSKFARSTFEVASQTRTLRPRLLFATYPYYRSWDPRFEYERSLFQCFGDTDISRLERNPLCQSLTPPPGVYMERVLASCNGLVVLGKTSYTNLSVWYPSTGFFRKIPSPGFRLDLEDGTFPITFAFGHVMAIDDYKLVFFVPEDFAVHIFSTRDGSWKVITFPHSSFPCRDDGEDLLVSNGAIHWVSTGIPEAISAFDLVSEEFRQLPLPPALIKSILNVEPVEDRDPRRIWTQVLVCVRSHNEYWVMKQYAGPESWVKMFQFSVADMPNVFASEYVYPAFVTEGGTVVMLSGMWLARIECHNEGKPVCSSRYQIKSVHVKKDMYRSGVMVYDETLLSL